MKLITNIKPDWLFFECSKYVWWTRSCSFDIIWITFVPTIIKNNYMNIFTAIISLYSIFIWDKNECEVVTSLALSIKYIFWRGSKILSTLDESSHTAQTNIHDIGWFSWIVLNTKIYLKGLKDFAIKTWRKEQVLESVHSCLIQ